MTDDDRAKALFAHLMLLVSVGAGAAHLRNLVHPPCDTHRRLASCYERLAPWAFAPRVEAPDFLFEVGSGTPQLLAMDSALTPSIRAV